MNPYKLNADADVRLDHEYKWPDGQFRAEPPYPCGAFRVPTHEQCTLLSDHDGDHVFASEKAISAVAPIHLTPEGSVTFAGAFSDRTVASATAATDQQEPARAADVIRSGAPRPLTVPWPLDPQAPADADPDKILGTIASPSVPGDGFDVLRELARARIYGDGALYFVEQHRAALDALLREHEERGRQISTYERVEHTVHAPRYANLREALDVTYPTAEEVVGAAIAAIHERNRLRTALEKRIAARAVQALADSEPDDDQMAGMDRLEGTPQASMFVIGAERLEQVIEVAISNAFFDGEIAAGHPAAATAEPPKEDQPDAEALPARATGEGGRAGNASAANDESPSILPTSPGVPAADVRFDHEYEWSDGQIRSEPPYRCGAFRFGTNEQCALLSDHDGDHVFASERKSSEQLAAPLAPGDGFDVLRELLAHFRFRRELIRGGQITAWVTDAQIVALDALLRDFEAQRRHIEVLEETERLAFANRLAEVTRLRTALEAAEADTRRLRRVWEGMPEAVRSHLDFDSYRASIDASQGASGPEEGQS